LGFKKKVESTSNINKYDVVDRGWRYHMNNINAAIGIAQLNKIDLLIHKRKYLSKIYLDLLNNFEEVELLPFNYNEIVPYIFVIKLVNYKSSYIQVEMKKKSIECGNHYFPPYLEPYFQKTIDYKLPVVENLYNRLLSLPLHCDLTKEDLKTVVANFKIVLQSI